MYRSYALYEEEKEYNVLKGQIPDFGYDVKFAVTVDNKKQDSIPGRKDTNGSYYKVKIDCQNGTTVGEWDYNAWNVKLDDISDGSKCTLAFTGGMGKEEYQKYIEQGVSTRRNTYRGKELKLTDDFWTSIQNGTFDDIYVGDYIKSKTNNNVTWLVADIDNYLNSGQQGHELRSHHLTIIPAEPLMYASMNEENTTAGGYTGSKMYKETLENVYSQYIQPDFTDSHILTYSTLLASEIDETKTNKFGTANGGASSKWEWVNDRKLDLMGEVNVYGTTIWSSSGYDSGIDYKQYAIFQLKPEFISSSSSLTEFNYWLKDVASSTDFTDVFECYAATSDARHTFGVRPRFLIG